MTLEKLAEREYPREDHPPGYHFVGSLQKQAFLQGAKLAVEFARYVISVLPSDFQGEVDLDKAFEIFLTKKYDSDEKMG
jgi:hypothetical protein